MALNWSIERCRDWRELTTDTEAAVTNAILILSMPCGFGKIEEKSAGKIAARIMAWELAFGPFLYTDSDGKLPRPITPADVSRRVGLSTNAREMTDKQFAAHLGQSLVQKANDAIRFSQPQPTA